MYGAQAEAAHDLGFDSSHIADAIRGTSQYQKTNCIVKRIVHPEVCKVFWVNRTKVRIYWVSLRYFLVSFVHGSWILSLSNFRSYWSFLQQLEWRLRFCKAVEIDRISMVLFNDAWQSCQKLLDLFAVEQPCAPWSDQNKKKQILFIYFSPHFTGLCHLLAMDMAYPLSIEGNKNQWNWGV